MQRPHFRHPRPGPRTAGFRSPPPAFDRTGSMVPSPPWAFSTPPPPFGPRFGQYSPNTPPREFFGNRGGSGGKHFSGQPPGHTPRRLNPSPRGTPYRRSPYDNSGRHAEHQGSPRTSTPFGSTHGRERGTNDMEKYYKPTMLQDPWADLKPISVTETESKSNSQQTTNTGRPGRIRKLCCGSTRQAIQPSLSFWPTPMEFADALNSEAHLLKILSYKRGHNNTSTSVS